MPLIRERNMYRQREEAEQRRRDQQFPGSIQDFHAISNKDVQVSTFPSNYHQPLTSAL